MNEKLKSIQEHLKQQGERVAKAAIERVKRELAVTAQEAATEVGENIDKFFGQVLGELNSDLKGKQ